MHCDFNIQSRYMNQLYYNTTFNFSFSEKKLRLKEFLHVFQATWKEFGFKFLSVWYDIQFNHYIVLPSPTTEPEFSENSHRLRNNHF